MSDAKTKRKEKTMSTHRFMYNDKQIFEQYETTTEASLEKEGMTPYVNRWATVVL